MSNLLVTGTTGILGSYFVKHILETTNDEVYCLVRARTEVEGLKRQLHAISAYGLLSNSDLNKKIHIVTGDVTKDNLGIEVNQYQHLLNNIDIIVHMAAAVSFFASDAELEQLNVNATSIVTQFVKDSKKAKVVYVSSYSVHGINKDKINFSEEDFDIGQSFKGIPYPKSKYLSEKIVRTNLDKDSYLIVRPGNIFGVSTNGRFPFYFHGGNDIFYNLLKTFIETGVSPDFNFQYDITPVDYIVEGIAHLIKKEDNWSRTFHLINPDKLSFKELAKITNKAGYPIKIIDVEAYYEMIVNNKLECKGLPYKSITTQMLFVYSKVFIHGNPICISCDITVDALKKHQISCPMNKDLLPIYYQYCTQIGYLNPSNIF